MKAKISVNLISGTLGAGKTTLLRNFLTQKPADENWLLLVNEFGAVGIDGAILEAASGTEVELVPGGCICCTAQAELKQTLEKIGQKTHIDRLLIEPTGLGEPDTIVDLFLALDLKDHFRIEALFSVFDLSSTRLDELKSMTIMQSLLTMADVILFNKSDKASNEQIQPLLDYCQQLYPPKEQVFVTRQSQAPVELLSLPHFQRTFFRPQSEAKSPFHSVKPQPKAPGLVVSDQISALPNLIERIIHQELDTQAIGWLFSPEQMFDWTQLQSLFDSFAQVPEIKRAKGVFRIRSPWMLFQYVNGEASREFIAYRKDSRLEILLEKDFQFDLIDFEAQLMNSMK